MYKQHLGVKTPLRKSKGYFSRICLFFQIMFTTFCMEMLSWDKTYSFLAFVTHISNLQFRIGIWGGTGFLLFSKFVPPGLTISNMSRFKSEKLCVNRDLRRYTNYIKKNYFFYSLWLIFSFKNIFIFRNSCYA